MQLIDTHCHLDDPRFADDLESVLQRARQQGIQRIIVPGVGAMRWSRQAEICRAHAGVHAAYGIHPWFLEQAGSGDAEALADWLQAHPACAVGEIGLDFAPGRPAKARQQACFEAQLELAAAQDLPVIIHAVRATEAVLQTLRRFSGLRGVVHAFNGSRQQADTLIERGFLLGAGGMLTHARNRKLRELFTAIPLEQVLLETDAPDQAGARHQGERNEPAFLADTLQALSSLRDMPAEDVARTCNHNAEVLFRW